MSAPVTNEAAVPGLPPGRFAAPALHGLIADAMRRCGLPAEGAAKVAELMTEADLTGADAHGIFRLPQYVRRLKAGGVNPTPALVVERRAPAVAMIDGDNGMGHVVMARAAETAIEMARDTGVAWVGVRRSNHAGPAALYAEMPVCHGMVGLYSVVASSNHMAVWGGTSSLLGTNPLAVGIPCGDAPPVVLDIATTVVSYGTVKKYVMQDKALPEGWLVSRADGAPVTDPRRTGEGLLLPIGGHKGSGLALILGILAGTLNGAAFGRDVVDFNADSSTETNTGHFILALDVERFMPAATFGALLKAQLDDLRSDTPLPGTGDIRLPGDQRAVRRAERGENGVPIPAPLERQLDELAAGLGIAPLGAR
ncbi:Ldh family oxidoreductase [Ancylobacter dichloromethanicus]|uniref:Lactate dehydrogenase n=1 Tax=Ancylobacter dichloromethanicus TaxID=518825 RepID=A0A9W6JCX6_9HYPH|nr:Ldh family oxidoreductase [Ancylobacter dichloromethanicus]MBS7552277.1 Ldh family oxidoreductase [Ancylobacter dichloromethanicus]GLK74013.1 lactate dehydrogenase [Ancylobacter dichloromethanicus]